MSKFINVITYLIGFLFIFNGFLWLINPSNIASSLGMALLSDHGLSTQIGDLASFFLVIGIFTILGTYKKKKFWFYAPIALLSFAALSRIIAFLFHGAALSVDKIVVELIIAGFLLFLIKRDENTIY